MEQEQKGRCSFIVYNPDKLGPQHLASKEFRNFGGLKYPTILLKNPNKLNGDDDIKLWGFDRVAILAAIEKIWKCK